MNTFTINFYKTLSGEGIWFDPIVVDSSLDSLLMFIPINYIPLRADDSKSGGMFVYWMKMTDYSIHFKPGDFVLMTEQKPTLDLAAVWGTGSLGDPITTQGVFYSISKTRNYNFERYNKISLVDVLKN